MPTKDRPEDHILTQFLTGYEDGRWADAEKDWVDKREDSGVDMVATHSDGDRLAIEHTLIEFFVGEREDFENFRGFLRVETDPRVVVPGKMIEVQVPKGTLVPGFKWDPVIEEFRLWLIEAIHDFPDDESIQTCPVRAKGIVGGSIAVSVRVLTTNNSSSRVFIRRYGDIDLAGTVEKALSSKLSKLAATPAERRILIFERNQFKLDEDQVFAEVERQRPNFPLLAKVDELWVAETIDSGYLGFRRYVNGEVTARFSFNNGQLHPGW